MGGASWIKQSHWLGDRSRMNREVHVRFCEGLGVRFPRATRLFISIQGQRLYLWRAVDQDGDVIDILVTKRRDRRTAKRFFRRALNHQGQAPWQLITDKLRSYPAAHRDIFPSVVHRTGHYENNRAEVSHQHTREQERQMRRFKSMGQTQRFLSVHGPIQNLFRVGRHHLKAVHYRLLRDRAFADWREATCTP